MSSKSYAVVKFAPAPETDKVEAERQLSNEEAASLDG
jgi:hypothetical protein